MFTHLGCHNMSPHVSRHVTSASGFHARWAFCQTPSLGTCRGCPRGISSQADWECQTEASWGSSRLKDSFPSSPHLGVPHARMCHSPFGSTPKVERGTLSSVCCFQGVHFLPGESVSFTPELNVPLIHFSPLLPSSPHQLHLFLPSSLH